MDISVTAFLAAIVVMGGPVILAALGETITEKAGVVNLSLDGTILLAAMVGFVTACATGQPGLGLLAGALTGGAVAAIVAFIGVHLGQSQVAVGFALTFLCRDLAYFLGSGHARVEGPQFEPLPLPLLSELPVVGKALFSQTLVIYLSFVAIPLCFYLLYRSRWGLIIRSVGENPEACWARGINPITVRMLATTAGGAMVGLAGAGYSLAVKPGWGQPQGCEGIGWIALALVIFGSWHPLRVVAGAYLFGFLQLMGIYFQDAFTTIPPQIFQVAPFPLMIFTLVIIHFSHRRNDVLARWLQLFSGTPPKAMGRPYRRD